MNSVTDKLMILKMKAKYGVRAFLYDENGDTNFISILIILGIVIALAAVFITFRNTITDWVSERMSSFFNDTGENSYGQ